MNTSSKTPSALLRLQQVADLLGVSLRQVWRYINDGRLPVRPLSARTVRVRAEDLEAFIQGGAVRS